eukprot:1159002-Pelagomonas_calceolata.AAC.3
MGVRMGVAPPANAGLCVCVSVHVYVCVARYNQAVADFIAFRGVCGCGWICACAGAALRGCVQVLKHLEIFNGGDWRGL